MSDPYGGAVSRRQDWMLPRFEPSAAERALLRSLRPIDVELFRSWLLSSGWSVRGSGSLGEMLERQGSTVAFPREVWQDPVRAEGLVLRIAVSMERAVGDVLKRLIAPLTDRVMLRLIGEELPTGRVPLGAASEILKNGRRMLSASGTSAVSPGWSVARRYRGEAQALARDAELAHTEDGSFIFPLYVALDRTEQPAISYDEDSVIPEPYERRVTRTLATALATTSELVDEPINSLSDDTLDSASIVGVTRELCKSVEAFLKSPAIDTVSIEFDWSPAFGATAALPHAVTFDRRQRGQLKSLAARLMHAEPIGAEVYAGPILSIGHGRDEDGFYVVIDTYFRERKNRLSVSLTADDHERAIAWYRDRSTVVVRGEAVRIKGDLTMNSPSRIEAWSEMRF